MSQKLPRQLIVELKHFFHKPVSLNAIGFNISLVHKRQRPAKSSIEEVEGVFPADVGTVPSSIGAVNLVALVTEPVVQLWGTVWTLNIHVVAHVLDSTAILEKNCGRSAVSLKRARVISGRMADMWWVIRSCKCLVD